MSPTSGDRCIMRALQPSNRSDLGETLYQDGVVLPSGSYVDCRTNGIVVLAIAQVNSSAGKGKNAATFNTGAESRASQEV